MVWSRKLWLVPSVAGGVLMAAAGVAPEEAVSNLSKWVELLGFSEAAGWLASHSADTWGMAIGATIVAGSLILFFRPRIIAWLGQQQRTKQPKPQKAPRIVHNDTEIAGGPTYWSLSEALSWIAFGEAITARQWGEKFRAEGLYIRPQEETDSFNKAEHLLFEALRGEKICALGKKNESQQYEEIPPEYFLSDVSCAILHDQIDVNPENIGARSKWDGPKWYDVRFKREAVLLLWPQGKEGKVELDELLVRDWNLSQAYDYWAKTTNEEGAFGTELEQAASEKRITIWGKRNYLNDAIFEPIPPNHWARSRIEIHAAIFSSSFGVSEDYILENSITKPRDVHDTSLEQYGYLRVTSVEIKKIWPAVNS